METLTNYTETEEGEVLDDDPGDLYVPLERPHTSTVCVKPPPQSESDDDNPLKESSSDSDSSAKRFISRKIRKKTLPLEKKDTVVKKKNYNIWCSDLQTEVLTNCLVDCKVDQLNDRSRDVESYNYKAALYSNDRNKFKDNYKVSKNNLKNQNPCKRKHDGVYAGEKINHKEKKNESTLASTRSILGLSTGVENTEEDIAKDIANKLYEEKDALILRALNILGKEAVISLFEKTRKVEAAGGLLVMNGTRRRTPGGVFFYLLKTSETLPRDKINLVLAEDKKTKNAEKKLMAKKMRQIQAEKLKKQLSKDDFPTLLSRTELAIKEFKARKLAEDSAEVKNPPPSPATDGKECSDGEEQKEGTGHTKFSERGRSLTTYDENLFGNEDTMEVV